MTAASQPAEPKLCGDQSCSRRDLWEPCDRPVGHNGPHLWSPAPFATYELALLPKAEASR